MKISNIILYFGVLLAFSSCVVPSYLPKAVDAAETVYGGYIKVTLLNKRKITGELLSSNNERITVMITGREYPTQIETKGIRKYTLQFAKPVMDPRAILNLVLPVTHGYIALITLPINTLIVAGIMTTENEEYKIFSEETTYEELSKYARYPQGLPPVYKRNSLD